VYVVFIMPGVERTWLSQSQPPVALGDVPAAVLEGWRHVR